MSKLPTINYEEWRQAIDEFHSQQMDKIPDGWITAEQLMVEKGCTITTARTFLNNLCSIGRAEKKKFRVEAECGIRPIYHYKLKKK